MAEYEAEHSINSYGAGVIEIEIPKDVLIYLLEIDLSKSKYSRFLDIIVLGDEDILYAGPLSEDLIQILFNSKKSKISSITIIIRPSPILTTTKWYIFNDEIRFLVNGVRQIGDVETNGPNFFDDESFQAEWG